MERTLWCNRFLVMLECFRSSFLFDERLRWFYLEYELVLRTVLIYPSHCGYAGITVQTITHPYDLETRPNNNFYYLITYFTCPSLNRC